MRMTSTRVAPGDDEDALSPSPSCEGQLVFYEADLF